jgi:hypothetical protein
MTRVREFNNRVARLIAQGRLDEAARTLEETAGILAARPTAPVDPDDLEPSLDEYFFRVHTVDLLWRRERHAEALPHAERAWTLELELIAAAQERGFTRQELDIVAFSAGTWGYLSVLTALGRLDEAERAFAAFVQDEELYQARHRHQALAAEQVLIAGLCLFWDDDARRRRGRELIARAERLGEPENPELAYGFTCFWALLGETRPALVALELALRRGAAPERALEDGDLAGLRGRPEFDALVVARVLTWKLTTIPPGARVFLDDVDTGALTPARLRPAPPGRHRVRFVLAGHQEHEFVHVQKGGAGLECTVGLTSLAKSAELERMLEDSGRQPDRFAREKTRTFLGPRLAGAGIRLARHTTYGLGGVRIEVHGDGQTRIAKEAFGPHEKAGEQSLQLEPEATEGLFNAFVEAAFTELVLGQAVGVPDELYFSLELTNGRGQAHALGKFVGTEHARFDALVELVWQTAAAALEPSVRKRLGL